MKELIAIIAHAERQLSIVAVQEPDAGDTDFESGAQAGVIEGKVAAYKDIIRFTAGKLVEAL